MKYLEMIAMLISAIVAVAGAVYYLSNRFSLFFSVLSLKSWLWILGVGSVFLMVATIAFFDKSQIIYIIGSYWIALMVYLLMTIALVDLVNLVVKIPPLTRGLMSLGLAVAVLVYGTINAFIFRVNEISIPIDGLTKEVRALHITDLHLGHFRGERFVKKVVDKINEINPNVVFNTGDMFDSGTHFSDQNNVLKPLERVTVPHFFVFGNHDEAVDVNEVIRRMKLSGAIVLQNEIAHFGELQIVGFENLLVDENVAMDWHTKPGAETIKSVMEKLPVDENRPTIALYHQPVGMEYMNAKNVDLLLAGHTHAGQFFPFNLLTKLKFPYNKGLYQYSDMFVYVSKGLGTIFSPIRIGTNSEMTLIRLIPKS
jgi:predicted MPP superfamily phosphohydrolase